MSLPFVSVARGAAQCKVLLNRLPAMLHRYYVIDLVHGQRETFRNTAIFAKAFSPFTDEVASTRFEISHCRQKARALIVRMLSPSAQGVPGIRNSPSLLRRGASSPRRGFSESVPLLAQPTEARDAN